MCGYHTHLMNYLLIYLLHLTLLHDTASACHHHTTYQVVCKHDQIITVQNRRRVCTSAILTRTTRVLGETNQTTTCRCALPI